MNHEVGLNTKTPMVVKCYIDLGFVEMFSSLKATKIDLKLVKNFKELSCSLKTAFSFPFKE